MLEDKQDLTIDQVARNLQRHRKTVEDYIARGILESYRIGRTYRITPDALERFKKKYIVRGEEEGKSDAKKVA